MTNASNTSQLEQELLTDLKKGNQAAFNHFYQIHSRIVYGRLKALVHDHEVAQELHQDTFLKVWQRRATLDPAVPFRAVLMRTAKSLAIDYFRKALRDKELRAVLISRATELYDHLDHLMDFNDANNNLEAAIAKLPPKRKAIFIAIKVDGNSYEKVALELGVSLSTVKDHMAKAMKFLKEEISRDHPELLLLLITAAMLK